MPLPPKPPIPHSPPSLFEGLGVSVGSVCFGNHKGNTVSGLDSGAMCCFSKYCCDLTETLHSPKPTETVSILHILHCATPIIEIGVEQ